MKITLHIKIRCCLTPYHFEAEVIRYRIFCVLLLAKYCNATNRKEFILETGISSWTRRLVESSSLGGIPRNIPPPPLREKGQKSKANFLSHQYFV